MIRVCLDKALAKYDISRYELSKRTGIQYQVIDNYYKNRVKRYDNYVLERICLALGCDIGDVLELKKIDTEPVDVEAKKTQVYISEELAAPFECWEKVGY